MGFREFFMEFHVRGVLDFKNNPIVPASIPKTGFRNSGAVKMNVWQPAKPYKPIFRVGKSLLKKP